MYCVDFLICVLDFVLCFGGVEIYFGWIGGFQCGWIQFGIVD